MLDGAPEYLCSYDPWGVVTLGGGVVARQMVGGDMVQRGWRGLSAQADATLGYFFLHVGVATSDLACPWSTKHMLLCNLGCDHLGRAALRLACRRRTSGRRPRDVVTVRGS
jgi:hypothetical protein